jgi:peptidoglycan/xylan/chitin deacetylase (PgdA/CDA1 family)
MSLKHQLLAACYQPLKLGNMLLKAGGASQRGRLRVLLYHDVAPADESRFAAQLRWLSQSWNFITPGEFSAIISGELPVLEDSLLLTFDDGFYSNRKIAEMVLNPMGIKALFFIVSEFAALSNPEDSHSFISQNIYPGMNLADVPVHMRNMRWNDLEYLIKTGHSIGAHTANHAFLTKTSKANLEKEIILSANAMEQKLGLKIEHFAYTFGNLTSFSPEALELARSRFKYIHTGLRGFNSSRVRPWAIRRDAINANNSLSLLGALLEGAADFVYSSDLTTYESWGSQTKC